VKRSENFRHRSTDKCLDSDVSVPLTMGLIAN